MRECLSSIFWHNTSRVFYRICNKYSAHDTIFDYSAPSTSFVSERVAQALGLHKSSETVKIFSVAGIAHKSSLHSIMEFTISSTLTPDEKIPVSSIAVPRVTTDLPSQPVPLNSQWHHLTKLHLSDPDFGIWSNWSPSWNRYNMLMCCWMAGEWVHLEHLKQNYSWSSQPQVVTTPCFSHDRMTTYFASSGNRRGSQTRLKSWWSLGGGC